MEIIYEDKSCVVVKKEHGVICEDTCENSIPALIRSASGKDTFPVHRIDKVAGGAVLMAYSPSAADKLRNFGFDKEYLFIVCGTPSESAGEYKDLLYHDTRTNKSFVVKKMRKGVREAVLWYEVIAVKGGYSLIKAKMLTGRTHQIRLQFSSRGTPLYGDRRYGGSGDGNTALWSYKLTFGRDGNKHTAISLPPTEIFPWSAFSEELSQL